MADSPGSDATHETHDDGQGGSSSKQHAAKDRECQYCHQKFTSSSLGRHLDQFLHKKKPDGIHNVEEIRRLRGGITRRTARNNSRQENDGSRTSNASPAPHQASPTVVDTLNATPLHGVDTKWNSMNWHSTGVINDLPPSHKVSASPINTPISTKRSFSTFAGKEQSFTNTGSTEKDVTIRALELSLREVLDSVRAATSRATPRTSPFTFDLQSQTFPSLCLTLLPHPPNLFSTSPFATSTSAPLFSPDSTHLSLLRLNLETKIQTWKWDSLRHAQSQTFPTAHAANLGEEADYLAHTASKYEEYARKHLDAAIAAWMSLSPAERAEKWQIELFRAFVSEKRKASELEERVEKLKQELSQLHDQNEQLSRCQWPREMALWPPDRIHFGKAGAEEIRRINVDLNGTDIGQSGEDFGGENEKDIGDRWDYEKLVGKWRKRVREDRGRRNGAAVGSIPPQMQTSKLAEIMNPGIGVTTDHQSRMELNGNANANTNANGSGGDARRKSMRQQQQHLVTSMADEDDAAREFKQALSYNKES